VQCNQRGVKNDDKFSVYLSKNYPKNNRNYLIEGTVEIKFKRMNF